MNNLLLRQLVVLATLFMSFGVSAQTEPQIQVSELKDYSNVAGTFHFISPTNNMHIWPASYIEGLYPEIEDLRLESENFYWHYSNDMIIVIYSRNYVNSPDFVPVPSPYNYTDKLD